jgi:hypothetical protein
MRRIVHYAKKKPGNGWWDDKKKQELIQSYILLGNLRQSAALNNVPEVTAKKWKATVWWREQEEELRRGTKLKLSSKLSEIVAKAMIQLEDRLDKGDFFWNRKSQEWLRKPVSAEHANKITGQLIDRVLAVEKAATPEKITDEGLEQRLLKLRADMLTFVPKRKSLEIIDVESVRTIPSVGEEQRSDGEGRVTPASTGEGSLRTGTDHGGDQVPGTSGRLACSQDSPTAG